jgi:hypothetical protein
VVHRVLRVGPSRKGVVVHRSYRVGLPPRAVTLL